MYEAMCALLNSIALLLIQALAVVMPGQFHAEISRRENQLTVFVKGIPIRAYPVSMGADDPEIIHDHNSQTYTVGKGDSLSDIASAFGTDAFALATINQLDPRSTLHVGQRIRVPTRRIRVTPTGDLRVIAVVHHPHYLQADGEWAKPFRENQANPLGTVWMPFDVTGYGIHGTNAPELIGQPSSDGCIRLRNNDVEELSSWLPMGTKVVIK
jgi:lipoprotein-anchoring transpeptidase ErfK/SrfK